MEHKNSMSRVERLHREKVTRYSIRKYSFGAASVAVAALFMFLGNGAVSANELSKQDTPSVEAPAKATEDKPTSEEATAKPVEATTPTLDKSELTNLISEIETKLSNGSYDNKTEESVAVLKADLEAAKATLANATTQAELKKAYSKLVTTANAGLRNKPVEKKETPAVDTTNGKETVGKKAENTEKKSDSNSIENTGSNDPRNGKELDKNNAFRAETDTEKPTVEIPFANGKNVYVYSGEAEGFDIKIKDNSGFITSATVKQGGNQNFNSVAGETDKRDVQYGYTINEITTKTPASDASPAVIHYRGVPGGELSAVQLEKIRTEGLTLGWRYVTATDEAENFIKNRAVGSSNATDPGSFNVIAKPQTFKYDPVALETANKVLVADLAQLTETDLNNIKNALKVEYSKTNDDAQLASKKGTLLDDAKTVVSSVAQSGSNLTVTYEDGSTDSIAVSSVARVNAAPTVQIPYSVEGRKDVFVYANEDFDIPIKFTDDSGKIASAEIVRGGNKVSPAKDASNPNILDNEYDTVVEKISTETQATADNPAVVHIRGKITKDTEGGSPVKKITLPTTESAELPVVTRYATATDTDGAYINNTATGSSYANDPGSFRIVLKAQTAKYDIKDPETKVTVANANNITEDEFNQIKNSIKIQYSTTNPDKNLLDKQGKDVENQTDRIESITREGNNVVVTYKDGSKDTKALADFVNVAPKVEVPYSNQTEKQVYVYTGENTDLTFKGTDEKEVKDLYLRGPGDVKWDNASGFRLTTGKVENGTVTGEGSVSEDKRTASIKMTGVTNLTAGKQWTSFIVSKDNDGKLSNTDYRAIDVDPNAKEKPGYVRFVVKNQTSKYDIAAPTEKVAVADPANVTADDLAKIKEKLKIEYAQTNDDANFADKKGKTVDAEDAKTKIQSVEKDNAGNLVVTYTDGSKDTRPLSEFVTLDKQPAIEAVEKAAEAQIAAINNTPNATDAEKTAAIAKVNADKEKALAEIAKPEVTTKEAVDAAKTAGTGEIAKENPVAKEAAKKAIDDALKAKEAEIAGRDDLTNEEKDAAKAEAKKLADAQLAEIAKQPDVAATPEAAATAQTAVDGAKDKGVADVTAVNPAAAKKPEAKKAIDDALKAKEAAIDARTDLTDDEKKAAKDAAKDTADKAKEAIDAAPSDAEVDKAKEAGTGAVEAINPEAKVKPEAKKAIDDALKAKEAAIDARTDLTDDEKKAAKDAAKDAADKAKEAIDAAPSNAEVDKAKEAGTGEIAKVNPVAKEAAKKAVADELAKKEAEIAGRNDLTDEEKAKAKEEAQAKAKEATDAIDAQPSNAETPEKAAEAQTAVDGAKDKGVADVKAVDPEAKAKPAAKKAIEDKLAKQLEDIANTPDATDDEKKVAADAAKALAEGAKKEIDKAGTDAEVKQLQEEAEGEIEKSVPVVEDKPNARKAIEDEAKAKKEAIDARTDLTPKAKEDLKAQVDAIADQAKKSVDAAKTSEAVDGIEESDKAAIKAVGEVNIPADKVLVNNPSALTDDEKAKVLEAVKKVNPDAKEITQEADGNVTVTTPDGHKEIITPEQVVKTAATANDPKAGNDIVKPADKVVVNDPAKLTDAEKEKIKAAVEAVNPNSIVVVDDKGNAKVSTPDGQTQVIPVEELVRTVEDTKKPNAGNDIVKPADKTAVKDPANLTPEEKKAIEDKVKAVNPGATVVVDDKGNATVTTPEGKTAVIPATDLTKDSEAATKPNAGNDIVKPADKTAVKNPANLTPEEKKAIEDKVKAVNPGATVVVDDKGNATVTTPEGKTAVIPAADLTKDPEAATKPNAGNDIVKPADKTAVKDPANLTPEEKKAIEDKVKAVNPGATVVVDDKGNTTVTTPEGKTAVIPAADLTKDPETATKPNAGNDIVKPADKTAVKDPANLTPEEKKAIEDKVKAVNPGATVVVDDKGNATVTTPEGKTAVIPAADLTKDPETATKPNAGNDIVKPADKTAVKDPANLTPEEKKAIEDKVKAVNPGATVVVDDKGNATVTTPEGKTAVIPATDLTKSPADAAKANAGNTVNTPAAKVEVKDPAKLTDEEKAKVKEAIEAVNPGSKVVVDDKGNATVTTPEGDVVVIPTTDLTKSPADAGKANAGNAVNTPAAKVEVKDPAKLTDEEKAKVKKAVEDVNPGSKVVVDDKGNTTVTTSEGKTATIPAADVTKSAADAGKANAGNAVNTPAAKVEVKDPANLTDAEKKAIEDKVKAVNPGSKVVVDDKGNVTVTTPEGKTATIPAADVTKSAADAGKANAGNGANTPATKTVVKDPAKLTDEEKAKVKKAVEDVNPGSTVVVNDKGDVIVTKGDGTVLVIPELDLVIPEDKLTDPTQQNGVNTPATRVLVGDKAKLTADEIEKVKESIKAVNPGSTVVVDDKGNATVTTPEGKTATIPAAQLVKDAKDVAAKNNGENINVDFEKETVANFNNLTDAEKEAAKAKIKGANADVVEVIFDKAGNATVITKDGKVYTIVAKDIFKQRPYVPSNGGGNNSGNGNGTSGNNGATNTDAKVDKAKLEGAIRQLDELIVKESAKLDAETAKEANALLADAKKVFANADASQAEVDAMVKRIEGFMAKVASSTDHATPANDQAAQTPAVDTATTQAASAQANARKVAKELPNTGTADSTVAMVAAAASALLGLGLAGRRRKEDEEA